MFEYESYKANNVYKDLYEALQKSLELDYSNQRLADQEEARKKRRKEESTHKNLLGFHNHSYLLQAGGIWAPRYFGTNQVFSVAATSTSSIDWYWLVKTDDHTPAAAASRKDWWKPLPEEERPATLEPAWTILPSNMSDVENNSASALASSYEPPAENSLLAKTGDMTTFWNWYCRQINKSKLTQAYLEGHTYEVVKVFYPDIIHLQFQMEECYKMLIDQVDWVNLEGDQVRINVNRPLPLGSMPVLSISKMKAARYPDFDLELLVLEQMWIEDVCS
ncbi:hypothetical protein Tco_1438897 [Tanacetum coccineum]